MISLQYEKDGVWRHTSAHCINSKFSYRVFVGKHNLVEDEAASKAVLPEKIVVHEKWNPIFVAFGNDIALIKLSEPVTLSDQVQLGRLPAAGTLLSNLQPCYNHWLEAPLLISWQQALMPVADHATCSQPDGGGSLSGPPWCGAGGDGIVAGCNVSPLTPRGVWEVHGIKPTVFTRVSAFNEWIDKVMMNN
uniref:Elastase 3 like n=1 Tax=Takifugu rubripes TaxID=31033 RepID=A0A674NJQ0_TAKRU